VWALPILGVRARRVVCGLSGRGAEHMNSGEKNEKKITCSNPHENTTCSSCYACTADTQAGGLHVARCETCEDATVMATIRAVRER